MGNFFFFLFCQYKKDNSYIDVFWSLTFVWPALALLGLRLFNENDEDPDARCYLTFGLVLIWALRLSIHIGVRHRGEDFRYQDMRKRWNEVGGYWGYLWRAFLYIFMGQGVFSVITNAAALYVYIYSNSGTKLIWSDFVGAAVWLFGLAFEWVGDNQLKNHLADKTPGKKKFIQHGLWRYTRHPNYFGECVLWWGIWLIACSVEWGFFTVFAPLFISLLIRFVSGVPLLEEKYQGRPEWEQYCRETNVFFPWFVNQEALKDGQNAVALQSQPTENA